MEAVGQSVEKDIGEVMEQSSHNTRNPSSVSSQKSSPDKFVNETELSNNTD